MHSAICQAIDGEGLTIVYQPVVDIRGGETVGGRGLPHQFNRGHVWRCRHCDATRDVSGKQFGNQATQAVTYAPDFVPDGWLPDGDALLPGPGRSVAHQLFTTWGICPTCAETSRAGPDRGPRRDVVYISRSSSQRGWDIGSHPLAVALVLEDSPHFHCRHRLLVGLIAEAATSTCTKSSFLRRAATAKSWCFYRPRSTNSQLSESAVD